MSSIVRSLVPCRLRMFSMTTMESSTTRPTAMVRAPRVRMFECVVPDHQSDHGDEQRHRDGDRGDDCGAEGAEEGQDHEDREEQSEPAFDGQIVDRLLDLWCLVEDRGERDVVTEFGPIVSRTSLTPWETSTTLSSCPLVTDTVTASLPSAREYEVFSTESSSTSATSPSRTVPSAVRSGVFSIWSTASSSSPTSTDRDLFPCPLCPAGNNGSLQQ